MLVFSVPSWPLPLWKRSSWMLTSTASGIHSVIIPILTSKMFMSWEWVFATIVVRFRLSPYITTQNISPNGMLRLAPSSPKIPNKKPQILRHSCYIYTLLYWAAWSLLVCLHWSFSFFWVGDAVPLTAAAPAGAAEALILCPGGVLQEPRTC